MDDVRNPTGIPSALAAELASASGLAGELGTATDDLNARLKAAEVAIARLKLGVVASTDISYEEEEVSGHEVRLAFAKHNNEWRLLVWTGWAGDDDSYDSSPLLNGSREMRLRAAEKLPDLVSAMVRAARAEVDLVRSTAGAVEAFTEGLVPYMKGDKDDPA